MTGFEKKEVFFIACLKPLSAIKKPDGTMMIRKFYDESFKPFVDEHTGEYFEPIMLPCGRCLQCRLSYARNWSNRLLLESRYYADNWFLTLTYDDMDSKLEYNSHGELVLVPDHFKKFMKDLRAFYDDNYGHQGVRFYVAGEYGDTTARPHYHMIALNLPIPDLKVYSRSALGDIYYTSEIINKRWKHGYVVIGEVTAESASYTARYVQKKAKQFIDYEKLDLVPEFVRMSRRPGIAADYVAENLVEIYKTDHIYLPGGKVAGVPRYFDVLAEKQGFDLTEVKKMRAERAKLVNEFTKQAVSREWCAQCDDLEKELQKRSKSLRRYL